MVHKYGMFDVNYNSIFDEDDYSILLDVTYEIIVKIKRTVNMDGLTHKFICNESEDNQFFFIDVDNIMKFCARIYDYEAIEIEPANNTEKLMRDFDISDEELRAIYDSDPSLENVPELPIYNCKCQVLLSIHNVAPCKRELANRILDEICIRK